MSIAQTGLRPATLSRATCHALGRPSTPVARLVAGSLPGLTIPALAAAQGAGGERIAVLGGIAVDDRSGVSVAVAGVVNSDGIDDLLIGTLNTFPNPRFERL